MKPPKPDERREVLASRRNRKMARSAHAYVRGSTIRFYDWLHSLPGQRLPHGPAVWICGDCHIGNLGPTADRQGRIEVHMRDFDQTVIGNPAHDLVRLALSLATAVRGSDLPGVVTACMMERMMAGYEQALSTDTDQAPPRPRQVKASLRDAIRRTWKQMARERIEDPLPTLPLGRHFWPLSKEERGALKALAAEPELRRLVTGLKSRDDEARVTLLDAAYWVKGCSSLGLLRYALILQVGDETEGDYCLIDIKQAARAAAPRASHAAMPRDNAQRVMTGARALSPALGRRMIATRLLGEGVFIRELLPQDLKLELDTLDRDEAMDVAFFLAGVVGQAHARQLDDTMRKRWLADLRRSHSRSLDAPSWLWTSVVQLVGSHEQAYLEHCRRYAVGI